MSQVFVSKLRKGASHNGYEMKPRKVKRGNTVYEMQPRTKNGRNSDPDGKITFSSPELQVFGQKLSSAAPHCGSCPRCHASHAGRIQSSCKLCGGRGWLSKGEFAACPHHERQELERLRQQNPLAQLA